MGGEGAETARTTGPYSTLWAPPRVLSSFSGCEGDQAASVAHLRQTSRTTSLAKVLCMQLINAYGRMINSLQ